jgi:hypothetical protein
VVIHWSEDVQSNANMAGRLRLGAAIEGDAAGAEHSIQYRGRAVTGWPCTVRQKPHYDSLVTISHFTSVIHVI